VSAPFNPRPVPPDERTLGAWDYTVLWGSYGAGLLVMVAGTLLVPALGFGAAIAAIVAGTVIGNLILLVPTVMGADHGLPTMASLRPTLGSAGSYLPSVVNVVQLVGWTAFELIIMTRAAGAITHRLLGTSLHWFWLVFFTLVCVAFALGGPLVVVRVWLEKVGIWLLLLTTVYLTYYLLSHYGLSRALSQPGKGGLTFPQAVDIVVAMPLSWLPLAADYSRFARSARRAALGTYVGFFVTNIWFYALGALAVLALGTSGIVQAILALPIGVAALILVLVDETDNAFADLYSCAVSAGNIFSRVPQRAFVVLFGVVAFVAAAVLPMGRYESFLFLLGSVFAPLFGVVTADYFLLRRRRIDADAVYEKSGPAFDWMAVFSWAVGVAAYQFITRDLPQVGASIPSFAIAGVLYLALRAVTRFLPGPGGRPDRPGS